MSSESPTRPLSGLTRRIVNVSRVLEEYSFPLLSGVLVGLVFANISAHSYEDMKHFNIFGHGVSLFGREVTLHYMVNEMFMVFFFGLAAKEITESILPGGALNPPGKAVNPLLGTLGGILGPVGVYFILTFAFYGGGDDFNAVARGWAIPTATDIALAWLVARMIFGPLHPAVNFLLLLAVADDAIGLLIIATFYTDPLHPIEPIWLLLTLGGIAVSYTLRRLGIGRWGPYIVIGGVMSWVGMTKSGIEPALALIVIVPFLPSEPHPRLGQHASHNSEQEESETDPAEPEKRPSHWEAVTAAISGHGRNSPLDQFEHRLKGIVDYGLFCFGLFNAGVAFTSVSSVTFVVLLSLVVGKSVGITLFSWLGVRLGFPMPTGMAFKHLLVTGIIAGIGLTVALFVATKAFEGEEFYEPAKMGAVLSPVAVALAFGAAWLLKVKEPPPDETAPDG